MRLRGLVVRLVSCVERLLCGREWLLLVCGLTGTVLLLPGGLLPSSLLPRSLLPRSLLPLIRLLSGVSGGSCRVSRLCGIGCLLVIIARAGRLMLLGVAVAVVSAVAGLPVRLIVVGAQGKSFHHSYHRAYRVSTQ